MASDRWQYEESTRRYRDTETGKFLSASSTRELRDDFVERRRAAVQDLADRVASGDLSVQAWEREMRGAVKQTHGVQYSLGRGGRNAMTDADWERLGEAVKGQQEYLRGFALEVADGALTAAQVAARSQLYLDAAVSSYERGRSAAYGAPDLPAMPADGSAECRANDRCSWEIEETDDEWRCTWTLGGGGDSATCETCARRADEWNPLVIEKPKEGRTNVLRFRVA